jgi:hypothetical protein
MDSYNNDTFLSNIKDSINYVIENRDKFILLLLVFVIIYFVDYITYINGILYSSPNSVPALPSLKTPTPPLHHFPNVKNPKVKRNKSRRR